MGLNLYKNSWKVGVGVRENSFPNMVNINNTIQL